jgi:uncharacterized protein (TIGR02001 family)
MTNLKSVFGAAVAAAIVSLAIPTAVLADDDSDRKFGYSVTLTGVSDYLFRGISLTDHTPAFQPFVEFTYGIAYLDFWGSNVKNGVGDPWELDIYAGLRPVTGPISWDVGVLYYQNPDAHFASDLDYVEFKLGASVTPVTNLTLSLTGYTTPDVGAASPWTQTVEGSAAYTLPKLAMFTPTLSGVIGYTNADSRPGWFLGHDDYTYWNAGVKLTVDKFFMDLRYYGTNIDKDPINNPRDLARDEFLFSAGVNLP